MNDKPRLLFHVQHMLGIGHRIRAERIALACVDVGFDVTLMEGGVPALECDTPPGLTRVQLPSARSADAAFSAVVDADTGQVVDDAWRARRLAASLAALETSQPDILLVEGFPFARRAFRFELVPLVQQARTMGARTVVSVRDILVARSDLSKVAQIAELTRLLFDTVLVHGDPGFAQLVDSFPAAAVVADRLIYTGIVSPPPPMPISDRPNLEQAGEVIVSCGGGAVGGALIRAAVAARPLSRLADRTWRILIGPNLPPEDRAVLDVLPNGIIVEAARHDFTSLLAGASLSISQAGYNTVADLAVTGCPSVLVPFAGPGGKETEQPMRAALLAAAGRVICLPEQDLTPGRLAQAVDRALALPRPSQSPYRLQGATQSAAALMDLLGGEGR
ncbi:glycosyltransferase family protein [Hwanghaeella sp. LZ110]|uniref:glycosyltransferase family protein n=1 Tax=Hwanghaeella sp. LZ110 TaxID=3402810 RepID=UPI003B684F2B